jgi:hypothetical protein
MDLIVATIGRLAALALTALLLAGLGAEGVAAADKASDYTSRDGMKSHCEHHGGTFTDTKDGNLWCQYPNGHLIVCDENGQDCWYARPRGPDLPEAPTTGHHAPIGGGGQSPPAADPATEATDDPVRQAADDEVSEEVSTRKEEIDHRRSKGRHDEP